MLVRNELIAFIILVSIMAACNERRTIYKSPEGYDLTKPEKFNMPEILHEISGIAFYKGNGDTIYAEQDEEGKVFHFKLGDRKMIISKFGKPGDFEDLTICNGYVIMLRSDGTLFSFPFEEANNANAEQVLEWRNLLPQGEFEGLASIDSSSKVFVLCKHCRDEKASKENGVFVFKLDSGAKLKYLARLEIDVRSIESIVGETKMRFHPSALTFNGFTDEWYILSSVNKLLVIADAEWKVKEVFHLKPQFFPQPEGIAIDNKRNLYISNERNTRDYGTILRFAYQKNREVQ